MNEVSNSDVIRALTTNSSRREAATASHAASQGQGTGKSLPAGSSPEKVEVRKASIQQSADKAQRSVDHAVDRLNDYVKSFQRDLKFSVDRELGRPIVHVIDRSTDKVIRQIPGEVALRLARNLQLQNDVLQSELQAGDSNRLGLVNTKI